MQNVYFSEHYRFPANRKKVACESYTYLTEEGETSAVIEVNVIQVLTFLSQCDTIICSSYNNLIQFGSQLDIICITIG